MTSALALWTRRTRWVASIVLLLVGIGAAFALLSREHTGSGHASLDTPGNKPAARSVLFVGDTYFGEAYSNDKRQRDALYGKGYDHAVSGVLPLLRAADVVVANLETSLTCLRDSPLRYTKEYVHWGEPQLTTGALTRSNISVVSLANNHAYDFLQPGLRDTMAALDAEGIGYFGAGPSLQAASAPYQQELKLSESAFSFAVIGTFERLRAYRKYGFYATARRGGVYGLRGAPLVRQIRKLKKDHSERFVIVFPHWGNNYAWRSRRQRRVARALIEAGADLVIGHGAHAFQEVERYRGRWILYSLGNFVFLSPGRYAQKKSHPWSMTAELVASAGAPLRLQLKLRFILSDNRKTGYVPALLTGAEFERATARLTGRSKVLQQAADGSSPVQKGQDGIGEFLLIELGSWPPSDRTGSPKR